MIGNAKDVVRKVYSGDAVKDASMLKLVGKEEGWDSHVMRIIELGPYGFSPKHEHDWEHINYIIEGEGTLFIDGEEKPVKAGSYAYVPAGELHQFRNATDKTMRFICIVPTRGHV